MSWTPERRTRNAAEFLERYRRIRTDYGAGPIPRLVELRRIYAGGRDVGEAALLEAHVRRHVVDPMLEALNWPISLAADPEQPDLAVEIPVRSQMRGTVRFLDYLGAGTGKPGGRCSSWRQNTRTTRGPSWPLRLARLKGRKRLLEG